MLRRLLFLLMLLLTASACNLASNEISPTPIITSTSIVSRVTATAASSVTDRPRATLPSITPRATTNATAAPTSANCTVRADWTTMYTVVIGDTLSSIAARANSTTRELVAANCLANANIISEGQRLRVPRVPVVWTPTPTATATATATLAGAAILSFTSSPNPANFNSNVTLAWQTRGAGGVVMRNANRTSLQISTSAMLPPNGSRTFSLMEPVITNGTITITLLLTDATGALLTNASGGNYSQDLIIRLNPYPTVVTFVSNPATVNAGGTATLAWTTQNATSASLSRLGSDGRVSEQLGTFSANGSTAVTIPTGVTSVTYFLSVIDASGVTNDARITLTVNATTCAFSSYISETCPTTQTANVASAYQSFQSGRMVWRGDTRQIYVLYNNGTAQVFSDTYNGETITPQNPPDPSLRQPMNGFGWLWQNDSTLRAAIGWANDVEASYNSTYETTSINRVYFTFPNNTIVRLENSSIWTTIAR